MRRGRTMSRALALLLCVVFALGLTSGMALRDEITEPAAGSADAEPSEGPAPTEEPAPVETAVPTEVPAPVETVEPTGTPAPVETVEPTETPAPDESAEPTETPVPEESAEPTETPAPGEPQDYTCVSGDGVTVRAAASPESGIPADAALHADKVEEGTETYTLAFDALWTQLGLAEGDELYFLPYDVYFTDAESARIEPESGLVQVTMQFPADPFADILNAAADEAADSGVMGDPGMMEGPGIEDLAPAVSAAPAPEMVTERFLAHILDDGSVERLEPETAADGTVTFSVGSFSVMGPALVRRAAAPAALSAEIYVPTAPEDMQDAVHADTIEAAAEQLAEEGGTIYLTDSVPMDTVTFDAKAVTIKSYGEGTAYTLSKAPEGAGENMLVLTNGAALTLENVTVDGAGNTLGRTVTASGGSTLTLNTGAVLANNMAFGAVYLDGSAIKIDGGAICGNAATKDEGTLAQITYGTAIRFAYNGANAGKQGLGGAVLMANNSTFDMTGGEISGNSAICGGGVYAYDSAVTTNGGTFSGNVADTAAADQAYGGAIHVDGAASPAVTIGGSAQFTGNSAQRGGAFSTGIDADTVALTITGGSFTGNIAKTYGSIAFISSKNSVIDISGAVFSGNSAAKEGGIYKGANAAKTPNGSGKFTISGGTQFINNTALKGPCVYVTKDNADAIKEFLVDSVTFSGNSAADNAGVIQYNVPNSTFTVKNSKFENNRSSNNGGCFYAAVDAKGTTFTFEESTFTGNYAKNQGGVWRGFPPQSEFLFKNCTFTDNTAETGDGGCFYFPGDGENSNITIDGGTFTGNKSGSSGGAFRANLNGGTVTVTGNAQFTGNSADVNAGAFSVRRKGTGFYGEVYLLSCTVDGNRCNANFDNYTEADLEPTKHYNTGGVYIGENITCYMYDALVTGNSVQGGYTGRTVGSGIALCPNAQVFLYPEHGAMIYGNGDGDTMDILAVPYDETINHETPAKLYVSSTTPDGRDYNWTDLNGGEARTGGYDWTNVRSGIATVAALDDGYQSETTLTPVGFKAHVADAGVMTAAAGTGYSVRIINNITRAADYGAGGMMVNGKVIAGEFKVNVEKKLDINGASSGREAAIYNTTFHFRFSIIDTKSAANASSLKTPGPVSYTTGSNAKGTLTFTKGTISYSGTDRDRIFCEFDLTGAETMNIGTIKKTDIGIYEDDVKDYYFQLEETNTGGASNVDIQNNTSSGSEISEFKFTVTNTFEFGELDLTKTVDGPNADENRPWTFHIEMDEAAGKTYPVELYAGSELVKGTVRQGSITFNGGKANLTFNGEGKADVQLKHGQRLKIRDLPIGATYTVTEDTADNYTSVPDNANGTLDSTAVKTAAFTNTRQTGDLSISKTVAGDAGDKTKPFQFEITLKDGGAPVSGSFSYDGAFTEKDGDSIDGGQITFTEGKATVYLTDSQTLTIRGLPAGAAYTVTEVDADQLPYETTKEKDSGTINNGETAAAAFTNTAKTGDLTITKALAGNGASADKEWHFTVTLTPPAGTELKAQYTYTGTGGKDGGSLTFTKTEPAGPWVSEALTLKGGQSVTITGLPVGTQYAVAETEAGQGGYTTQAEGSNGSITEAGKPEAKFTNARYLGDLAITKTVTGSEGDKTKEWHFTITLTPPAGDSLAEQYDYTLTGPGAESKSGQVTVDKAAGTIKIDGTDVTLKHGQTITITGLPAGTQYTVAETEANEDGYGTESTVPTGTIPAEKKAEVRFTNTKPYGGLSVTKTVTGTGGDRDKAWNFTVKLEDETVTGTFGQMDFDKGEARFTLKHGETKTAEGLPADVKYTVTEAEADKDGYATTSTGETGTIPKEDIAKAEFVNGKDADAPEETPSPTPTGTVPDTGDQARPGLWLALTVLTALAAIGTGAALLARRRRSGRDK